MSKKPDAASGEARDEEAHDPRPVSDDRLREEVTREQVERWRREADESHSNWFSVMNNPYGKD